MEIVEDRDDYCVEEEEDEEKRVMMAGGEMGKHQTFPFYPSSSSPSPSSSSQYKGAAPQPNGRWGGQIYEKHQRLWNMGTFDSRDAAAKTLGFANYSPFDAMDTTGSHSHRGDGDEDGQGPGGGLRGVEREHMFDKVVTPSDVGKLNRLVIPKQHAEKYFPLDSSANEKGLLLSFEDRSGKPWRFRYSYWNSSQSYVMTKGWSRFVKEKKLDAGDIVSFERGLGELGKDRLYIDWKRRPDTGLDSSIRGVPLPHHPMSLHRSVPWGRIFFPPTVSLPVPPQTHMQQLNYDHSNYGYNVVNPAGSIFYLRSAGPHGVAALQQHGGGGGGGIGGGDTSSAVPMVFDSVPVVHGKASAKRLRLFGVNLECPTGDEADNDVLSSAHPMSSLLPQPQQQPQPSPPLQLRLYGGGPLPTSAQDLPRKTRQSLSFDLDI